MAKSDFDSSDQEYDVVYDENQKGSFFSKMGKRQKKKDDSLNTSMVDQAILDNLNSNSYANDNSEDFSDNVVFEEKQNMSFLDRIIDYFSTINIRGLIVVVGIILIISVAIFMVVLSITKASKAYSADIIIPDIVYMGETANVGVSVKYDGNGKAKKDINDTETTFESDNESILYVLSKSVKGSSVLNTIIPIQEGRTEISASSKLDGKVIGSDKKEVVVCPELNTSLIRAKSISMTKDSKYYLTIDFGEDECARGVTYSIDDESIATVEQDGTVSGVKVGKAVLTIRRGTRSISVNVNVTDERVSLRSFKVTSNDVQLSVGDKYRINFDYAPADATQFSVSFNGGSYDVAKVSKTGVIEALGVGTTTVNVYASYSLKETIDVTVKDDSNTNFATNLVLDNTDLKLVQGSSKKVRFALVPKDVSNKVVKWQSSDEEIAFVTSDGTIYAKNVGKAVVTAFTDNGVSKKINVTVDGIKGPNVVSNDRIASDNWHTRSYILSLSGAGNGFEYFYGTSENQMIPTSNKLIVNKDENKTYYIKSCARVCRETCNEKENENGSIEKDSNGKPIYVCTSECSDSPSICSESTIYVSKLDKTRPTISTVVPSGSKTVQIAFNDSMSSVKKWCVTSRNSYGACKWKTIEVSYNPVVQYLAPSSGTYYAFAKDIAGNISNGYKFNIDD